MLPWAVAIAKEEGGGPLDLLMGDTVAGWHRDGFLQSLEKKWGLPPSPFLREARTTWQQTDESGELTCRRNEQGLWPLECREVALVTGSGIGGLSGFSLTIMEVTGLDISILYDPLDRDVFLYGLALTAALSAITVFGSIVVGVIFGWLMHRRVFGISHFLRAFSEFIRMTPPLLQLYIVFFGLGGRAAFARINGRRLLGGCRGPVALCRSEQCDRLRAGLRCRRYGRPQAEVHAAGREPGFQALLCRDHGQLCQHREGHRHGQHPRSARAGSRQHPRSWRRRVMPT